MTGKLTVETASETVRADVLDSARIILVGEVPILLRSHDTDFFYILDTQFPIGRHEHRTQ